MQSSGLEHHVVVVHGCEDVEEHSGSVFTGHEKQYFLTETAVLTPIRLHSPVTQNTNFES